MTIQFKREFCMPNPNTFSLKPVAELLGRYVNGGITVDPFSRNSLIASIRNDIDPKSSAHYHLDAVEFCDYLIGLQTQADVVLLDPPYSPRQMSEAYKNAGLKVGMTETQNARLYKEVKDRLAEILKPDGIAICCGWNSMGFGLTMGFEMLEILMVAHGAAHNDTIVTVERKSAN